MRENTKGRSSIEVSVLGPTYFPRGDVRVTKQSFWVESKQQVKSGIRRKILEMTSTERVSPPRSKASCIGSARPFIA